MKDVAEEVVDEKLDEKLPHDEHEEEVLEAKQDDTIKELAELVKGLTDRLDVLTTRTTELEKKLDTFGVVEEQAEIGLGSNQTPSGAKVSDALTDVLRALNNR